jgi:alginate O-acetyltransferase complex protein AlgJ
MTEDCSNVLDLGLPEGIAMKPSASFIKFYNSMAMILSTVFLLLLWLPTLDSFFDLDHSPWLNEKREPAPFPKITLDVNGLRTLPAGLGAYYDDHFGFRRRLILWEQRWKQKYFKEASRPDVMFGREGWLFYADNQMIENYRGVKKFTLEELQNWQVLLEKRRDWLAKRGIKYLFVIPPDKHSIYPEYLSAWLTKVGPQTKLDQFLAYMKAHSTVQVLDLRPGLLEAKKTARTYLYTDTHWNSYGGFIGYQYLMRALALQLPDLGEPLPYEAFEPTRVLEKGGDLVLMLGQNDAEEREGVQLAARPPLQLPQVKEDINIFVKQWPKFTDPVYTENPLGKYNILIFRDSFSGALTPFLGYHFKRAVYIWEYNWNSQVIEREKPDVVVDEILERFFNMLDTKKTMAEDALP